MTDPATGNARRVSIVLAAFGAVIAVLVLGVGLLLGAPAIAVVVIAVLVALAATWVAYQRSDAVVLRVSRAEPADASDHARLHNLVEGLCVASGLSKPDLYVVRDDAPNAFATGRSTDHAAVVVTTGLLEALNRIELEAVLARELNRIKSHDAAVGTVAVTTVALPTLVADLLVRKRWWNGGRLDRNDRTDTGPAALASLGSALLVTSPVVAKLLHRVVRPEQEVLADLAAVEATRYPPGLLGALEKLRDDSTVVHAGVRSTAHLWLAAPLACTDAEGHLAGRNRLFVTHPPIDQRIEALREL